MRREDNVVREQRLRRRQRIIRLTVHLGQRRAAPERRQEGHARGPRIPGHALLALAQLEPVPPAGDQLERPQVPVAEEGLDDAALVAEVAVDDGRRQRLLELLLALHVPAVEEPLVRAEAGLCGDAQAPGEGDGVAEAGRDPLTADLELVLVETTVRVPDGQSLQGGKTWAESPHRITRPSDHLLQLRAEKLKGLDRTTSMQFSGNAKSSSKLLKLTFS